MAQNVILMANKENKLFGFCVKLYLGNLNSLFNILHDSSMKGQEIQNSNATFPDKTFSILLNIHVLVSVISIPRNC